MENQLCFQILGFDVMLDADLKPWVIEVNHAPSMATDSYFDKAIKMQLVEDTLRLLNLSHKRKQEYIKTERANFQLRTRTGKAVYKLTPEQKEEKRKAIDEERNEIEQDLLGGYELIYPLADIPENQQMREQYEAFLAKSQSIYDNFNIGRKKVRPHQDQQGNPLGGPERRARANGASMVHNEAATRINQRAGP